jgi:hypothetical protein
LLSSLTQFDLFDGLGLMCRPSQVPALLQHVVTWVAAINRDSQGSFPPHAEIREPGSKTVAIS